MQQEQSPTQHTQDAPLPEQAQVVPAPAPEPRVIETASATTSPDNANSGAKPVLIAVVGVIVLLLLSSAIGSAVTGFLGYAIERESQGDTVSLGGHGDGTGYGQYEETYDDGVYGLGLGAYHAPTRGTASAARLG